MTVQPAPTHRGALAQVMRQLCRGRPHYSPSSGMVTGHRTRCCTPNHHGLAIAAAASSASLFDQPHLKVPVGLLRELHVEEY